MDWHDLVDLKELGHGHHGVVYLTRHVPTNRLMARKVLSIRPSPQHRLRKSLSAELETLESSSSPYIVECYGSCRLPGSMEVSLLMEYMDLGSTDGICEQFGPLPEFALKRIAHGVVGGLIYLWDHLKVMHRDLKPSNILLNSAGQVKMCDFGVSVQMAKDRAAHSVVGTTGYMSPERIQGHQYTVQSEVWSLGITLMELATGTYPYNVQREDRQCLSPPITSIMTSSTGSISQLALVELWEEINGEDVPALNSECFSLSFVDFVGRCVVKDPADRAQLEELAMHPFLLDLEQNDEQYMQWISSIQTRTNK